MPHPGDDGSFGPLLDRNTFRASDGAAANRRGMIGDGTRELVGKSGVCRVKRQVRHDRSMKILHVLKLNFVTAASIGHFLLGVVVCRPLCSEFSANSVNGRGLRPNAPGEYLAPFLLLHDPVIAGCFYPAGESRVTRRQ